MKKSVIMVSSSGGISFDPIERALIERGFRTLRVSSPAEAFFRLEGEAFSVALWDDSGSVSVQPQIVSALASRPFGATTPLVFLGGSSEPRDRSALTSILDQYFAISTPPADIAEFVEETHQLRREKAKRGQISAVSVPRILYSASRLRMTGAVVFERGEEKCIVYLEEGYVTFASSNRDENRFGEFLCQQGVISREQLSHAIALLRSTRKRMGRILVDEGILKPQILTTLVQSQVKHIIFTIFDWNIGEFVILFDERSGQEEPIARFEVGPLVLEGIRFKFTEEMLNREFSPFDAMVSLAMPIDECQRRIHLGKNELDFVRLLGGGRPIAELLSLNSYSRLDSLKLLYGLNVLGLLALEKGRAQPVRSTPSRSERARVVRELFAPKIAAPKPVVAKPSPPAPAQTSRLAYVGGAFATAGTVIVLSIVVMFFDPRFSRDGETTTTSPALKVKPQKPAVESPTAVASPSVSVVDEPTVEPTPPTLAAVAPPAPPSKTEELQRLISLADHYRKTGNLPLAISTYRRAYQLSPQHVEMILAYADTLFEGDRVEEAENFYLQASELAPRDPRPHVALGSLYQMRQEPELAAQSYHRYLALVPLTSQTQARIVEVRKILKTLEGR